MADKHFAVFNSDDGWLLRQYADLYVSGRPISEAVVPLRNGLRIQAGTTEFEVTIEGPVVAPAVAEPSAEYAKIEAPPATPLHFVLRTPKQLEVSWEASRLGQVLASLSDGANLFCLLNRKRLRRELEDFPLASANLFEQAPVEIRETDSLHVAQAAPDTIEEQAESALTASRQDGLILLVAELTLPELLDALKFTAAWYARPSSLSFQLASGSELLCKKLLGPFRCVVTAHRQDPDKLHVFAMPELMEPLQSRLGKLSLAATRPASVAS